ncbi:SubName: Full=Uncharacterized protein {ECO:0000313/EMBL:CCA69485.1} [Serendipita indica DSM 11827]|nr:SubName: Full=Uncharacterized protein {ECO:0000313/EMBL:CCA69485.1} [Serendipita indica DSM 11827]
MNVEYFQKLCWIWEWNPEIKKQQQSPNNVILAQERIRRGSGFCVNTTTHVTLYSSDSTPAYGIGIEVNWSQEDVAGGRVGGVSALARWTSAANKRMSALREKLLMWMKNVIYLHIVDIDAKRADIHTSGRLATSGTVGAITLPEGFTDAFHALFVARGVDRISIKTCQPPDRLGGYAGLSTQPPVYNTHLLISSKRHASSYDPEASGLAQTPKVQERERRKLGYEDWHHHICALYEDSASEKGSVAWI